MTKLFKDLRISFIVLNRERYENMFLPEMENSDSSFIGNTVKDMLRSLVTDDVAYKQFQDCYFNSLDYTSWVRMKRDYARDVLNRLNSDHVLHTDDLDSLRQYFLFYSALEYFQPSWYCLPSLEFSHEFYAAVLPKHFQCLLNHENGPARYQYQLEQIALTDPSTKSPDNPRGQRYYLLNERLIDDLMEEIRGVSQEALSRAVVHEYQLIRDALQKAKDARVYVIITSF